MDSETEESLQTQARASSERELREANSCIALGAGVGALGIGAAMITGATCPLCVVIAPALAAIGIAKRRKQKKQTASGNNA